MYTEPVPLNYGKIAAKYPWVYGYFYSVPSAGWEISILPTADWQRSAAGKVTSRASHICDISTYRLVGGHRILKEIRELNP